MPHTKKFKKMRKAMRKHYGRKKGTLVAYATAKKRRMHIHRRRRR